MKNIYDCLFEKKMFGVELHCDAIVFDILIFELDNLKLRALQRD